MSELQAFFREALNERITALEVALSALEQGDADALESLRRLGHALKGAGSSFGFPEISVLAGAVEQAGPSEMPERVNALLSVLTRTATNPPRAVVLVIDDDPLLTRLLEHKLAGANREVRIARTIEEAEQALSSGRVELILLDLFLPDADGRTLLGELRSRPETAGIPIFVMSGSSSLVARTECLALGADSFIQKPFDVDALAAMVGAALSRRRWQTSGAVHGAAATAREVVLSAFHRLLEEHEFVAVASMSPEVHRPGSDGAAVSEDDFISMLQALEETLPEDAVAARWSPGELIVVAALSEEELAHLIDTVRIRERNRPGRKGALVTFSAGVVTTDGASGLADAYARASSLADRAHRAGGDRVLTGHRRSGRARVLLAEDDTLTAALIIHRLEREGFEVEHYTEGLGALQAGSEGDFAVAILDVQMPGLDGFEVLARLRANPSATYLPVVMLTAMGSERDVVRGFDLGADDYILKPFSPAELTARLRRLMDRS